MPSRSSWLKAQIAEKNYHRLATAKKTLSSKPSQYLNNQFHLKSTFFQGQKVLEVGVAVWSTIHNLDGAILKVGIDPLAKYFSKVYPHSAEHIHGRGEELPFPHASFDTAICLNTLDHTEDPASVLNELRRCLKADGTLLLSVSTFALPKFLRNTLLRKTDPMHPHHFGELEVLKMLKRASFTPKRRHYRDKSFAQIRRKIRSMILAKRFDSALKYFAAKVLAGIQETWIMCN